jgi:hypothetical protein
VTALPARLRWWRKWPLRGRWLLALVAVGLLPVLAAAAGLAALLAEGSGAVPAVVPAGSGAGLWLGHAWAGGGKTAADLDALAARVRRAGIADLFVHVGPLSDDGSLRPARHPRDRWLLAGLHARLPGVRVQAWLGDLVTPGHLRLADPRTRARVLRAAAGLLTDGFGGIHYDLEPVPSGDRGYLALLTATHALTRARHRILSVAADQLEPLPGLRLPEQWAFGAPHWWSAGFLRAVAARTDEIALMIYDTAMPAPAAYTGYVRLETQLAAGVIPPRVTLLIGLPAYHTSEPGHTGAETVAAAIRGVRLALGAHPRHRRTGVALYADFAARPAYLAGWASLRRQDKRAA